MGHLESVLQHMSLFHRLRVDEIARIADFFRVFELPQGGRLAVATKGGEPFMVVVATGRVVVEVTVGKAVSRAELEPGDRYGMAGLLIGQARPATLVAVREARVATLDRVSFDALLHEFPAVAVPVACAMASELRACNDAVRQALELHAEGLPPDELKAATDEWRAGFIAHAARVSRLSPGALFRRLVVQQGGEPPFWMLTGFVLSLGLARLVVHLILKFHLEKQLFALVPGADPNPMHVHHFNYGLLLIGASGLAAMVPFGRKVLRSLAFVFGFGCGLVFDEFALFWNLNPEYSQRLSLVACAGAAAVLVQLTYFRQFWWALARRVYVSRRR